MNNLEQWGWDNSWSKLCESFGTNVVPARILAHQHHTYQLVAGYDGHNVSAEISGRFAHAAGSAEEYPTLGDWVAVDRVDKNGSGRIVAVLPRRSAVRRRAVGGGAAAAQVIAANIDTLFIVFGLDGGRNFLISLLERAVTVAWESGATPVILLNKTDLVESDQRDLFYVDASEAAPGVPVFLVSARTGEGLDQLDQFLAPGRTVALLGKSGVGKSALVNALNSTDDSSDPLAEEGSLRGDLQGRHTTTDKRLYQLPSGALIADVPGLRELGIWADGEDLEQTFSDIAAFAADCRFRDCTHRDEPGCAVQQAVAEGKLQASRLERYFELQRELAYLDARPGNPGYQDTKARWKSISKEIRRYYKNRDR